MANIREMVDSRYLKQSDIDGEQIVTIEKVGKLNIAKEGDEPEHKWAVRFVGVRKPMLLNATNIKRLAKACQSEETDSWIGKKVTLYVDHDVEFGGNVVGGLRIKGTPVAAQPRTVPGKPVNGEEMSDDVPW